MKSRAQELFDRIETGGKAAIDRLIAETAAEELFLDFKNSSQNGAGPNLHADDARNLCPQ
jgi:hypothetical protein